MFKQIFVGHIANSLTAINSNLLTEFNQPVTTGTVARVKAVLKAFEVLGITDGATLLQTVAMMGYAHQGMELPSEIGILFGIEPSQVPQEQPQVLEVVSEPEPVGKPVLLRKADAVPEGTSSSGPARTLEAEVPAVPRKTIRQITDEIGALACYRKIIAEEGTGPHYWDQCREALAPVLEEKLLNADDFATLVANMKRNLFFSGRQGNLFMQQCPPELLPELLFEGNESLTTHVAEIGLETHRSHDSQQRLAFIMDCCKKVGPNAKDLLIKCSQVVNRMKMKKFIGEDHWLVEKSGEMIHARKPIPRNKPVVRVSSRVAVAPVAAIVAGATESKEVVAKIVADDKSQGYVVNGFHAADVTLTPEAPAEVASA